MDRMGFSEMLFRNYRRICKSKKLCFTRVGVYRGDIATCKEVLHRQYPSSAKPDGKSYGT